MKDLIKLNGYQVSPTEIENVILTLPKVAEVAVVGIEDELCGQLPKAYIVLEKNADELLFLKHLEHTMKGSHIHQHVFNNQLTIQKSCLR